MSAVESKLILAAMVAAVPELMNLFPSPRPKTVYQVADNDHARMAAAQAKRERKAAKRAAAAGKGA